MTIMADVERIETGAKGTACEAWLAEHPEPERVEFVPPGTPHRKKLQARLDWTSGFKTKTEEWRLARSRAEAHCDHCIEIRQAERAEAERRETARRVTAERQAAEQKAKLQLWLSAWPLPNCRARTAARLLIQLDRPNPDEYLQATAWVQVESVAWAILKSERGWQRDHRSKSSLYLTRWDDERNSWVRLRLSNHEIPETDERLHNRTVGRTCCDSEVVFAGTENRFAALKRVLEETA